MGKGYICDEEFSVLVCPNNMCDGGANDAFSVWRDNLQIKSD